MSDKLKETEEKIDDAEKRLAALKLEILNLTNRLDKKRTEQDAAILEDKPTDTIESEVVILQTKLSGTQRAFEKQSQILGAFQEEKKSELRAIGRSQSEQAKEESFEIAGRIHAMLVESINLIPELKAKNLEFLAALKMTNSKIVNAESRNLNELALLLEKELPKIRAFFPDEIRANRNLAKINERRQALKR